ncbi:MAG: tetratricopeptide repeat protein [Bacteroidota bacterium]
MKPKNKSQVKSAIQPQKTAAKAKNPGIKLLVAGTGVIALVAFLVFSPCLKGEFLGWDDYNYIRDNELIKVFSWANIRHIFHYKTIVVGNYHPLTVLSYVFEYRLVGLNPFLYHFDNLLLHLFNILLFAWLMWLLTKKSYATLLATALFALHPMRVESVVWAAERKDVLYAFFFLLSLIFYVHFLVKSRRNSQYYFLSLIFFLLSVLSKGQAVVLPLTLFLVDYWFQKKLSVRSVLNKLPYLAISLVSGILAITAQHSSLTENRLMAHSLFERAAFALFNVSAYLYKLVYPFNLSCFYKYPAVNDMGGVYAGALGAVIITGAAAFFFRKNRMVVFGALFFLFTLSIVSQILPVGNAIIADRYTYIPYIGLFFIIGLLFDRVVGSKQKYKGAIIAIPVVILVVFSVRSYAQSLTWHNNETLWKNALKYDPDDGVALTNLGWEYIDRKEYPTAIDLLQRAIQNEATYIECFHAYQNLGYAHSMLGMKEEAVRNFTSAITRQPGYVDGYFNRGLAYSEMGKYDSAVADFTTILTSYNATHTRALYSRGSAFNKLNQPDRAIADYTSAIRIDPGYSGAYVNRGNIYFAQNMFEKAIEDYNIALKITADDGNTWLNRSFASFRLHRYRNALDDAMKARDLKMAVPPKYILDLQSAVKAP